MLPRLALNSRAPTTQAPKLRLQECTAMSGPISLLRKSKTTD
jgi:hypothetical protein